MSQTNPVLEAVNIVTESKIKDLKFDKTITGNIIDVVNEDEGIYRAEYEVGSFLVYSEDPKMIYAVGDSIYIKIPEGDYSNKKFIEGKIKRGEDTVSKIKLSNTFIYSGKVFDFKEISKKTWEINDTSINSYFNRYYGANKYVKITATFDGEDIKYKNYGLKIHFINVDNTIDTAHWDTTGMSGSILIGGIQYKYFNIPNQLTKITCEYFHEDENPTISCQNIQLEFFEEVNFTETPYYLQINQLDNEPLKLQGRLFSEGKETKGLSYQWYKQEIIDRAPSVDAEAGFGYRKIEGATSSSYEGAETATHQLNYKLIVEYEEGKKIATEYTINPTGNTIPINNEDIINTYYYDPIKGIVSGTTSYATLQRIIVDKDNNIYADTWFNSGANPVQIIGQVLFHYNANSDISAVIADKEYILTPQVSSQYNIKSMKWYLTSGLGEEDTDNVYDDNNLIKAGEKYNPHHSMLKNIWIDSNNCLRYSIKDTYSISNYNNIFRLVIETDDNEKPKLYQTQEIFFIQDGQQGTNGSEYCCIVRPVDSTGAYINDEDAIYYPGSPISLKVSVFKNSQEIQLNLDQEKDSDSLKWHNNSTDQIITINSNDKQFATVNVIVDQYELYYHYPIYYSANEDTKLTYLEAPKFVQYAASGYSPQWYNRIIKYNEDGVLGNFDTWIVDKKIKPPSQFSSGTVKTISITNKESVTIKCPVMMYVEYQSNSTIKGWDGTDIQGYNRQGELEKIINPQVGVGYTDNDGIYHGIVMSEDSGGGLYGYDEDGFNTIGLMADGKAYFDTIEISHRRTIDNAEYGIQGEIGRIRGQEYVQLENGNTQLVTTHNIGLRSSTSSPLEGEKGETYYPSVILETVKNIKLDAKSQESTEDEDKGNIYLQAKHNIEFDANKVNIPHKSFKINGEDYLTFINNNIIGLTSPAPGSLVAIINELQSSLATLSTKVASLESKVNSMGNSGGSGGGNNSSGTS